MPWDINNETVTVDSTSSLEVAGNTWQAQVEKFPLVQVDFVNSAITNSRTLTLTAEWSLDGEDWNTLGTILNAVAPGTGDAFVDTSIFSSKPAGAKYFRVKALASGPITSGQVMINTMTYAWWIEDSENSSGARSI